MNDNEIFTTQYNGATPDEVDEAMELLMTLAEFVGDPTNLPFEDQPDAYLDGAFEDRYEF